jgi:hypothetical protein
MHSTLYVARATAGEEVGEELIKARVSFCGIVLFVTFVPMLIHSVYASLYPVRRFFACPVRTKIPTAATAEVVFIEILVNEKFQLGIDVEIVIF